MNEQELFDSEIEESHGLPFDSDIKDREYYETEIARENFRKKKMENDLKSGQLCHKREADEAFREILDAMLLFFHAFEEVVPFEAHGKTIEESKEIHSSAVAACRKKMEEAMEKFIAAGANDA
jgi:hypothetical protein